MYDQLEQKREKLFEKLDSMVIERNVLLSEVLKKAKKDFPGKKVIILGGYRHFTKDPALEKKLVAYPYIALMPTYIDLKEDYAQKTKDFIDGGMK